MEILTKTDTATIYKDNDKLLKVFNPNLIDEKLNNQILLNYLLNPIQNIILPTDLFYQNEIISGYYMPFIDAIDLKKYFEAEVNIPLENRIKIINDLFAALEEIHKYLILGDIHLGNILINDTGYITDLDYARSIFEKDEPVSKFYLTSQDNLCLSNSKNSDINKLFICCLSILFQIDLESFLYGPWPTNDEIIRIFSDIPNNYILYYVYDLKKHENDPNYTNYFKINNDLDIGKNIDEVKRQLIKNLHY